MGSVLSGRSCLALLATITLAACGGGGSAPEKSAGARAGNAGASARGGAGGTSAAGESDGGEANASQTTGGDAGSGRGAEPGTGGTSASGGRGGSGASGGNDSSGGSGPRGGSGGSGGTGANTDGGSGDVTGDGGASPTASCGNGIVDGDDECEQLDGCTAGQRCTASCTCETPSSLPPSSQELIEQALLAGSIDYPTSLEYRVWALFQAPELPADYDGVGSQGEDEQLFIELSHVRGSLPTDIEAAIEPYLARPDDPLSIYSRTTEARRINLTDLPTPPPVGCPVTDIGQPDWRFNETDHFVIWSCGGGVGGTDPHATGRAAMGVMAEDVLGKLQPQLRALVPDDYPAGPAPQTRTDIYILDLNQCRQRGGYCTPIPGGTLAAAAPTTPCGRNGSGPLTSSSYLVVGAASVPSTAPAEGDASELRYILAHEIFHALSFGLNFEAQSGICTPNGSSLNEAERSWLSEASAEWASFATFADDDPGRRTELFTRYEVYRDPSTQGLHATSGSLPYQAFLYPLFVQEENSNKPDAMFAFWRGLDGARNQVDLDDRLNSTLGFADHFRDFAVRNFNRDLPGDPVAVPHSAIDDALHFGSPVSFVPEPSVELNAPLDLHPSLKLAPLAAQTLHYYVSDQTRYVRVDLGGTPNAEHLTLDAIVKVGSKWRRERVSGSVYEFCRDDAKDDISDFYLIVSNYDRQRDGASDGDFHLETKRECPSGWSGTIHVVTTTDEHYTASSSSNEQVYDLHDRQDDLWTVTGSISYLPPGFPVGFENDRLLATWRGERTIDDYSTDTDTNTGCTAIFTRLISGSGTADTTFDIVPVSDHVEFEPTGDTHNFDAPGESGNYGCGSSVVDAASDLTVESVHSINDTPAFADFTEDPDDPGHFTGTYDVTHYEGQLTGGQSISDSTITWDLRRVDRSPKP